MGLGPIMAIYQARFMKYLKDRGLLDTDDRKVWAFMGDGEMDEPESLGAISLAAREKLDNLIFVVNCNLQRLDGPVRGNGKIIQELEADFRGAGWNVIKVIWGSYWDPLLARDTTGLLLKRMEEAVDGEYQTFKSKDGAYVRKHFFGKYPELLAMVANMSDDDIWRLNRGGHDPHKIYAAYAAAVKHKGQPTVILAKTIKGYGMGEAGEGQNITHQQKKMGTTSIKAFRDRFDIPIPDDKLEEVPFFKPAEDSPEMKYLRERIAALGGSLPQRRQKAAPLEVPALSAFEALLEASGEREMSTTMAFVRILNVLVRDKNIGKLVVPIVPDESRTFGMEGMFRQLGHLLVGRPAVPPAGCRPADVLQGRQERADPAGGHQRGRRDVVVDRGGHVVQHARGVDDPVLHLLLDVRLPARRRSGLGGGRQPRARLPAGGTAGRTTLNGEGLQHEDGHSHLLSSTDPELHLLRSDLRLRGGRDHPGRPAPDVQGAGGRLLLHHGDERELRAPGDAGGRARAGILKGMYLLRGGERRARARRACSCSAAARSCAKSSPRRTCWSRTSAWPRTCGAARASTSCAAKAWRWSAGTCCIPRSRSASVCRAVPGRARPARWSPPPTTCALSPTRSGRSSKRNYLVLGTDGFGRSDFRQQLRKFFEVDRHYVTVAALKALAEDGAVPAAHGDAGDQEVRHRPQQALPLAGLAEPIAAYGSTTITTRRRPWERSRTSSSPTSATSRTCR